MATKTKKAKAEKPKEPDPLVVTVESLEANAVLLEQQRDALEITPAHPLAEAAFDEAAAILYDAAERCKKPTMEPLIEAEV